MPSVGRVEGQYDPHRVEEWVKGFWEKKHVYKLVKEKNRGGKRFNFIDGPPYPSGAVPHIGTAWNKVLKDAILRYKRMRGYDVFDRPGYDCHGLPIEVKVEQKLGIRVKREIEEKIGVEKFIEECRGLALRNVESLTHWFKELGVFMDWENPYLTLRDEYIEAGWWLIKKAADQGLLDREERVVYWCPRCSTTLAEYEIEHADLIDPSIYVKFPVRGREREYLLIWTTTPWTLPANTFIMAHPEETYVRVRVGGDTLILAKARLKNVMEEADVKDYVVLEEFPGEALAGIEYDHPLRDLVPLQEKLSRYHRVVMAPEFVTMHEGTGLVHGAPGHGREDFEVARREGIDYIASPVDDEGRFTEEAGKYAGMYVRKANDVIIEDLRAAGALFHEGSILHKYPVCWRCKTPVLMRTTKQWILRVTKLRDKLVEEAGKVEWIPGWALDRLMHMLENLQDWVLSRQRYWGSPLPVWECPEGHRVVVGSLRELEELGGERPKELHKPWIDRVVLKCPVCGRPMRRVPDVLDVWFDSAIAFYAAKGHPEKLSIEDVILDFIVEGHDQTRGWFFSLLRAGVLGFSRAPYRKVLVHGFVLDEHGREMHKSLGNYVGTDEAIEKMGRDPLRLWVLQNTVWEDPRFSWRWVEEARRDLAIAWNTFVFASTYMSLDGYDPSSHGLGEAAGSLRIEDRWMLSRINSLVKKVTENMERYHVHEAVRALRRFIVEDVSHWYIRLIRPRVWVEENTGDKLAAYAVLYHALWKWLLMASAFTPFLAEKIYQDMYRPSLRDARESIHLYEWPGVDEEYIDRELEEKMDTIRDIYEAVAAARMKAGLKLRQPVRRVVVFTSDPAVAEAAESMKDLLARLANARSIEVRPVERLEEIMEYSVEPVPRSLGPRYRKLTPLITRYIEENPEPVARDILSRGEHRLVLQGREITLTRGDVKITPRYIEGYSVVEKPWGSVAVDTRLTEEEIAEGAARDIVRRIQVMRKELGISLDDYIDTVIALPEKLAELVARHRDYIAGETRSKTIEITTAEPSGEAWDIVREWEIMGEKITIYIRKHREE